MRHHRSPSAPPSLPAVLQFSRSWSASEPSCSSSPCSTVSSSSDPASLHYSSLHVYNNSLECEDVHVLDRFWGWKRRRLAVYNRETRVLLTIRKRKKKEDREEERGEVLREIDLACTLGIHSEQHPAGGSVLWLLFSSSAPLCIRFRALSSAQQMRSWVESILGPCKSVAGLSLQHTPYLAPLRCLDHPALLFIMKGRVSIYDRRKDTLVHSSPLRHLELVGGVEGSLWLAFDDLRLSPHKYFSLSGGAIVSRLLATFT